MDTSDKRSHPDIINDCKDLDMEFEIKQVCFQVCDIEAFSPG